MFGKTAFICGVPLAYNALTVFFLGRWEGGRWGVLFSVYCLSTNHPPLEAFSEISSEPSNGFYSTLHALPGSSIRIPFPNIIFINSK